MLPLLASTPPFAVDPSPLVDWEPSLVVVCRFDYFQARSMDFGHSWLQTLRPAFFLESSTSCCTATIFQLTSTCWRMEPTRRSCGSYSQMRVMHTPARGLLSFTRGFSSAPRCRRPPLLLLLCGFLFFCFVFLLCYLCFSFLVFLCFFVGYLGFYLLDPMFCFILETFVPKFRGDLSSPMAHDGNAMPLQVG